MPKKYTKALHKRVAKSTNDIFNEAVCEITGIAMFNEEGKIAEEFKDIVITLRSANSHYFVIPNEETKHLSDLKVKIDETYLERIIKLPTKVLEEILFSHDQLKIRRAERTIEIITSELTRRMIMGDTSESNNKKR